MAQRKTEDQFLRNAFDKVYQEVDHLQHIDVDEVKHQLKKTTQVNRRALGMSLVIIALAILVIVGLFASQAVMEHIAWQNRPTFEQRLTAPYDLESKYPPYLLNAVTVDAQVNSMMTFATGNIEYYKTAEQPESTQLLATVVKLQSIVPAHFGDFSLQWDRSQSSLLAQCLLFTGASEQGKCATLHMAEFIEPANFVNTAGDSVSLVMSKFADNTQASATMDSIYDYARKIGRVGNYALTDLMNVDYFYSVTRETISFTWMNENWILSVSSGEFDTIDQFMTVFPLYENNPNLSQLVVEQISKNTVAPVVEETAEPAGLTDLSAVSGTQSE